MSESREIEIATVLGGYCLVLTDEYIPIDERVFKTREEAIDAKINWQWSQHPS